MELSSPSNPDIDPSARPSRRKSGRVSKKPEFLAPGPAGKRKRNDGDVDVEDQDGDADMDDASETASDDDDDDPDEEELREQRRKKKKKRRGNADRPKPAAPRRKPNGVASGASTTLVRRPAKKAAKAKKGQFEAEAAEEIGGLYGSVFGGEDTLESVAADWLQRYEQHEANAVAEIVNFALRCAGCEVEIDGHDVLDVDNAANKLSDIQDEFQEQPQVDYPLITKSKGAANFRKTMTNFINVVIHSTAAKGVLTEQLELIENVENWLGTMSSANNRPFRHTATVVSLEITLALAELGRAAVDNQAKILRQAEGEKKSKKVNQSRVAHLETLAGESNERAAQIDQFIKSWFDVVFVHRYRDVDPRIRVDCVSYLSEWICTYPEEFLDGAHLRYLGWVLSDNVASTRLQVVRDMQKIFKDDSKIGGLRQFTERFRPRMVEMATRDGDLNVRCTCIELLDILRDKGLLEPDDVDVIGKLVFDVEPRVRNAVAPFFAANVEDVHQSKLEDMENVDEEALHEFEQNEDEDDFEAYKIGWVRLKSIAELLRSYDYSESESERLIDLEASAINDTAEPIHSRISLAAQALFHHLSALQNWETLAGYLLKDITQHANIANSDDIPAYLDNACCLEAAEEAILLDVLNVSVKNALATVTSDDSNKRRGRKTKKELAQLAEAQETAAQHLAALIPRLLKKYGSQPQSTSAVLRLEHVLNLDVFAQLREDSTTYASLLDDINRQFMQHEAASVIHSAKQALLHAKSFEELQEITDGRLAALWDDTAITLTRLCRGEQVNVRGNFHVSVINALSATTLRIANLASISDATDALEQTRTVTSSNPRRKSGSSAKAAVLPVQCLLDIVARGIITDPDLDAELNTAEDLLVDHALRTLTFYLMWRVSSLRQPSTRVDPTSLVDLRDRYTSLTTTIRSIITSRRAADPLRVKAAETLLEATTLFSTLRHRAHESSTLADTLDLPSSARLTSPSCRAVLSVFAAVERDFAKKAGKTLNDASSDEHETRDREREAIEAEPASSDDDEGSSIDHDQDEERADALRQRKQRSALLAEQALCQLAGKMVLAVIGGCVDDGGEMGRRLEGNAGRLGRNLADVVGTLKGRGEGRGMRRKVEKKPREVVDEREGRVEEGPELEEDGEEDLRVRELVVEDMDGDEGEGREEAEREVESVLGD